MDGGRLANFRHPALSESFAVLACDVVPPRVASGCAGALSGADARRPSGSDSPTPGFGVRRLSESTKRFDLTESGRTIVITIEIVREGWSASRRGMECGPKPTLKLCFARCSAAFNARDLEGTLALMHADVTWANGWEGGWVNSMTVGPPGIRHVRAKCPSPGSLTGVRAIFDLCNRPWVQRSRPGIAVAPLIWCVRSRTKEVK